MFSYLKFHEKEIGEGSSSPLFFKGVHLPYVRLGVIPHTLSVVNISNTRASQYRYYGYLGPKGMGKICLLGSNDLTSWNYLKGMRETGVRWPSVEIGRHKKVWMAHTAHYQDKSYITIKKSLDGFSFSEGEKLVFDTSSRRDQNPFLHFDKEKMEWLLYWFKKPAASQWEIWVKRGTTIQELLHKGGKALLTVSYPLAAPSIFYNQYTGNYILQAEVFLDNKWQIQAFRSSNPDKNFSLMTENSIYNFAACPFPYVEEDMVYNFLATYFPPTSSLSSPDQRVWYLTLSKIPLSADLTSLFEATQCLPHINISLSQLCKVSALNLYSILANFKEFLELYKK